jgi:3-hydroxyisobutyrate dehydrogenase-like beta-hydroxyacid dehydrogenase
LTRPASDNLPSAAVLGLGLIGSRVAARVRDAGLPLAVWNRTPREFPGLPALAADPGAAARDADILQIFVADDEALGTTVEAILPVLGPRHVVLSHATVAPTTVRELATRVAATGAAFLDAPFTGSRDAAAQGQITYYVSGDADAFARARPVLAASAKAILPFGAIGQASALKIATNIMAAAAAVSLAEAVQLLRSNGVDPRVLPTALENNAARSGVTDLKLPCMLDDDFAPRFSARNMRKDLRLARDTAAPGHHTLTDAMLTLYEAACAAGLAEEDFATVIKVNSPDTESSASRKTEH